MANVKMMKVSTYKEEQMEVWHLGRLEKRCGVRKRVSNGGSGVNNGRRE